jgi:hypothetical protein
MVPCAVLLVVLAILGLLGVFFGADTRDGRDWKPSDAQ